MNKRGTKRKFLDDFCASCRGESSAVCSCDIKNLHEEQWKLNTVHTRQLIVQIKFKQVSWKTVEECFEYVIDWSTRLQETGETLLHALCMNPKVCTRKVVQELLLEEDLGLNINERNLLHPDRYAPLHYAAQSMNHEMLRALLLMNADVSLVDAKGRTALMIAAEDGHMDTGSTILKFAEDIDVTYSIKDRTLSDCALDGCIKRATAAPLRKLLQSKYPIHIPNIKSRVDDIKRNVAFTSAHPRIAAEIIEMLYLSAELWEKHKLSVSDLLHVLVPLPPEIADIVFEYY